MTPVLANDSEQNGSEAGVKGSWQAVIRFQRIEYQFAAGVLIRTVAVRAVARVDGDSMSGTFTGLVGGTFFRSGSFTATRVPAQGP